MVSTEKVYDMLPIVVDLYDKLNAEEYLKKIRKENQSKKNVDSKTVGIAVFKYILKNSSKVKDEVFEIVAIFEEKTVEEIKSQNFMTTINSLKKIFSDKDTVDFLKQAME
jgi:hypothetical protein